MHPVIRNQTPFNRFNSSAIRIGLALASLLCTTGSAQGDRLSADMLPPDVTLTPAKAGATASTTAAAAGTQAPGLPGGAQLGQPGNLPYGGAPSGAAAQAGAGKGAAATAAASAGLPARIPAHGEAMFKGPPADPNKKDPIATIDTVKGTIKVMLFRKLAPNTAANFIDLAQRGFYNGLNFHRVEPGFCIQGGDPNGNGTGLYIDPETKQPRFVALEVNSQLKHNAPGVVAMARFGKSPNSASCDFYITLKASPHLDGQYGIFGGVVEGMDVVNKIAIGDKINTITIEEQP